MEGQDDGEGLESLIRAWDGETVITHLDHETGAWIFIALHSTRRGPAGGGTRMKTYATPAEALRDAMRLAEGMTAKFAVSDLPRGGGKAVIAVPPGLSPEARTGLLGRYGGLIRSLGGLFQTGPDVGTNERDMDLIAVAGAPYVFGRTPAAGGAGDSGPATAVGVLAGLRVLARRLFGTESLAGRHVLVQGAGSVGWPLIQQLRAMDAVVVQFSEVEPRAAQRARDLLGATMEVAPEAVYRTPCDLFAPCALGGILSAETIPQLACRGIAGSANNQLATPEDAERLKARGIVYAPDFVVNVGGAMFLLGRETLGWSEEEAEAKIARTVTTTLERTLALAIERDLPTTQAAEDIIAERLG